MSLVMKRAFGVATLVGILGACTHGSPPIDAGGAPTTTEAPKPSALTAPAHEDSALVMLTEEEACRLNVSARGAIRADAKPYTREDGSCKDSMCDVAEIPPKGADACFIAETNIARAERDVRASGARRAGASAAWDKKTPPKYWDRVDGHLHLDDREQAMLHQNGFVVLDREPYANYAVAYHGVFQSQLPVYIGIDSIFNAVYQSSQSLLGELEDKKLGPALARMLDRMRSTLVASGGRYDADTIADLEVYLAVAHRLLHGSYNAEPLKDAELEALVASIVGSAEGGQGLEAVSMFGRERMIDYSQFTPRGRYADTNYGSGFDVPAGPPPGTAHIAPSAYFQSMMWLSRLELNIVSRSCRSSQPGAVTDPSETPREARDALALADLVNRAGENADLALFESSYSVFAGRREDLSLPALSALAAKGHIGVRDNDAPARLRAAIGNDFQRTANTHFMPEGTTSLPVITTMFGPRIVPDVAPLTELVHPKIPDRFVLGAADVGYVLGHDRAKNYLAEDLKKYPDLGPALDRGRQAVAKSAGAKGDVYAAWLDATRKLAEPPSGIAPSFTHTAAYADYRLDATLAAYAQIRHTFVLLAAQGYDMYGCEIPDGYVEPALSAYDALLDWVRTAQRAVPSRREYFARVTQILQTLRSIAATEAAGQALSEPQRRWLGMVAEYTPTGGSNGDSGAPPLYTGWYFDLFPDREQGAERAVELVADYFTLTNANQVRYLGIRPAAMGVFVVDTSGEPRVMVGPVANAYEVSTPIAERLNDARAKKAPNKLAPWQASYLAPERAEPDVAARAYLCADGARVVVQAGAEMDASVQLLDHHGDALGPAVSHAIGTAPIAIGITVPDGMRERGLEGLHLGVRTKSDHWDFVNDPNSYGADADPDARSVRRLGMSLGKYRTTKPEPAADE